MLTIKSNINKIDRITISTISISETFKLLITIKKIGIQKHDIVIKLRIERIPQIDMKQKIPEINTKMLVLLNVSALNPLPKVHIYIARQFNTI